MLFLQPAITDPVIASQSADGNVSFINMNKPVVSQGFDTYVQAAIEPWEFYLGYTYTYAIRKYEPVQQFVPITPRNRAATVISFEPEGSSWRVGVEASYSGFQYRLIMPKLPATCLQQP